MAANKAKTRNLRSRITTSLDPELLRLLDAQVQERGLTRSEAVEEAITDWVRRHVEEDLEAAEGFGARFDLLGDAVRKQGSNTRAMLSRNRYALEMILELLMEFRPGTDRDDLRRKAHAVIEAERERDRSRRRSEARSEATGGAGG